MPPQRTMPPSKALKTERTHEENQERAYIAASRRSDRSLEARVESARRASEIHKRRTGRSLRVTEQDVVNEEMYEEEDDDLPVQYRRLTAHLQTGSADFNRRLSNYLTNHVAMRSALDQAITSAYAQQYPNAPQFAHNQNGYPSPFPQQSATSKQAPQPGYQPYPSPGTPGFRAQRSSSMSHTNSYSPRMQAPAAPHATTQVDHRRASGSSKSASNSPSIAGSAPEVMQGRGSQLQPSPPTSVSHMDLPRRMTAPAITSTSAYQQQLVSQARAQSSQQQQQQQMLRPSSRSGAYPNISPFTTSLPPESQMLLGPALDPNDPTTAMLMAGSEHLPMPFSYDTNPSLKPHGLGHSLEGMSATLAPSALDMSLGNHNILQGQSGVGSGQGTGFMNSNFGMDSSLSEFAKGQGMYASGNSSQGSGAVTPGLEGGWDAFINDSSWAENPT